jgi:hypothetical protein
MPVVKKTAAKGKKTTSTAIIPWTEKFAKYAKETKEQTKNIGVGGVSIKFGRGRISIGDVEVKGGKLECVIVGSCALNRWNEQPFDASNPLPPDCYAFSVISDDPEMAPHPSAPDKQAVKCADCEKNQFGTARVGKGKACGNTIRLGLLTGNDATEDADSVAAAEMANAGVSPTNLNHYKKYTDLLEEEYGRPPWAVVTEIASYDDPKTQIRLEFKMVSLIDDDDVLQALEKRVLKVQEQLQKPFSVADKTAKKAPAASKSNSKFAGKKTTRR